MSNTPSEQFTVFSAGSAHRRSLVLSKIKLASIIFGFGLTVTIALSAATTFTTLVNFDSNHGSYPGYVSLVQGLDGNLYGTTTSGGDLSCSYVTYGCGTVFKMTPSGTLTVLHNFNGTDGAGPNAGLVLATNGTFYGTAYTYGANNGGTVFKLTSGGTLTTLYNFCSQMSGSTCSDGQYPTGLVQGTDGNFYETTFFGGDSTCSSFGCGVVFKITPSGTPTVLHSFGGYPNDGDGPESGVIQATDGNFYGTTHTGGKYNGGIVFKITPAGKLTVLYNFCSQFNCPDGADPYGTLVQGKDGNLYGTTFNGGTSTNGTVFKITPAGVLTTLLNLNGTTGINPSAGLVQGTDGNFYAVTQTSGLHNGGAIFKMTPTVPTVLYNFCSQISGSNCKDGVGPDGTLVQHTNGKFYGVTYAGGTGSCTYNPGCGTIFSLSVGLGAFVETLPTSGKVGAGVDILGSNLIGANAVSFNGTGATFSVVSATEIKATVPNGATTGLVTVTVASGALKSNKAFRVTPQITSFTPIGGAVGTVVTITGVSLTQTTVVTFGGVRATSFTVISDTEVKATVPTGAKTGHIAITTSGGTATSGGTFTVT